MNATPLQTESLKLVATTLDEVRAQLTGMDVDQKAALSAEWLARVKAATSADAFWTLGFTLVHRATLVFPLLRVLPLCGFLLTLFLERLLAHPLGLGRS